MEFTTKKFSLGFQSKFSPENTFLCPGKLYLSIQDFRSLKVPIGTIISLQSNNTLLYFQLWPVKSIPTGSAVISNLWKPNFLCEEKIFLNFNVLPKAQFTDISSINLISIERNHDYSNLEDLPSFLQSLLMNSFLSVGAKIHTNWRSTPCQFLVNSFEIESNSTCLIFRMGGSTKLSLLNLNPSRSLSAIPSRPKSLVSELEHRVSKSFGGYSPQLTTCCSMVSMWVNRDPGIISPRGLLLFGPPGTGKSTLAHALSRSTDNPIFELKRELLLSKFVGDAEAQLFGVFQQIGRVGPSILLIEDIEVIFCDRSVGNELQKRLVSCLLSFLDGINITSADFFLIATTSNPSLIDPALRRPGRLDREVELSVPTEEDRLSILSILLKNHNVSLDDVGPLCRREIAARAHGMVASDLLVALKDAHSLAIDHLSQTSKISETDLKSAFSRIRPSAMREITVEVAKTHWGDIGGMETVKQSLKEVVEWPILYPQFFQRLGLSPPRGVLLYGPPGCSKTLLARALATEGGMNFLTVRGPELLSKWLGESERAIQTLFRRARSVSPSLIFFDEIDALAGKRGEGSGGVSDRVLSQLLAELDGAQERGRVVVVAATNRPDMLDPALLRPGRMDRKIFVYPPDSLSREQILNLRLASSPIGNDIDISELVLRTEGFSGAEVVAVVREAAFAAMEETERDPEAQPTALISMCHLLGAIESITPQITPQMNEFYQNIQNEFKI